MSKNTLVLGDTHGGFEALANTLMAAGAVDRDGNKNPDWRVVHVGDLANMAPLGDDFRGFHSEDLATVGFGATVVDDLVVGNHEVFYTHGLNVGRWGGMGDQNAGHFDTDLVPFMKSLVFQGKYVAAVEVDGMLVTHAGLHRDFAKDYSNDPAEVAATLNEQLMMLARRDVDPHSFPALTDWDKSVFWLRPQMQGYDGPWKFGQGTDYMQVCGHTPDRSHPKFYPHLNAWIIDNGEYANLDNPTVGALVKREGESDFSVFSPVTEGATL